MENITLELSKFIHDLTFDAIPEKVVERIKVSLLDTIGCAFAGSESEWCRIVNLFVRQQGGVMESKLWATDFVGPAANVALGNGTMVHSFDFDDYHNAKIHPGAVVIPAAVAMGEKGRADGKSVLTAVVAGYETMIRVSAATGPASSRLKGWHLTGTTGTFGAAAAASKILRLDEDKTASALGMAGTQSAGLWAFNADGSMSKRFHAGRSSQSGVMAALLAGMGFRGPTKILEAEDGGFCRATSDQVNLAKAIDKLGEIFLGEDVNIKPYACCASIHSSIDAVGHLVRLHRIRTDDIAKITVKTARGVEVQCGLEDAPLNMLQAQMSLRYCIAAFLLDGRLLLEQFTEEKISDIRISELAKRVEILLDPEIERIYPEKFASKVEILLSDGSRVEGRVDSPVGSSESPMSFSRIAGKFRSLAGKSVTENRMDEIITRVENFEKIEDMRNFTALLSK